MARKAAGRRSNGEGSIFQRADGRWVAIYTLPDGKRKDLYGKTADDVNRKLLELRANLAKGIMPVAENVTVSQFIERWLEDAVSGSVRPATLDSYRKSQGSISCLSLALRGSRRYKGRTLKDSIASSCRAEGGTGRDYQQKQCSKRIGAYRVRSRRLSDGT